MSQLNTPLPKRLTSDLAIAKWLNQMLDCIRERTPLRSPLLNLRFGPNGFAYNAPAISGGFDLVSTKKELLDVKIDEGGADDEAILTCVDLVNPTIKYYVVRPDQLMIAPDDGFPAGAFGDRWKFWTDEGYTGEKTGDEAYQARTYQKTFSVAAQGGGTQDLVFTLREQIVPLFRAGQQITMIKGDSPFAVITKDDVFNEANSSVIFNRYLNTERSWVLDVHPGEVCVNGEPQYTVIHRSDPPLPKP